jgi:tetratricopeptide (TPR) repeat protein
MRAFTMLLLIASTAHAQRGDWPSFMALGEERVAAGEWRKARNAFDRARNLDPSQPGTWFELGRADAKLGRCEEALRELKRFRRDAPDDPRAAEAEVLRETCRHVDDHRIGRNNLIGGVITTLIGIPLLVGGSFLASRPEQPCNGGEDDPCLKLNMPVGLVLAVPGAIMTAAGLSLAISGGIKIRESNVSIAPSFSSNGGGIRVGVSF